MKITDFRDLKYANPTKNPVEKHYLAKRAVISMTTYWGLKTETIHIYQPEYTHKWISPGIVISEDMRDQIGILYAVAVMEFKHD